MSLENAIEQFQTEKAKLFGTDGKPLHIEAEHKRRLDALQTDLQSTVDSITSAADTRIADAQAKVTTLEAKSPMDALSAGELERANSLRTFVHEDITTAPIADLVIRLKSILATGQDKPSLFLFARYLPARLELEGEKPKSEPQRIALFELGQLLRQAQEKLNPNQQEAIKKLKAEIESAQLEAARARRAMLDTQPSRPLVHF